MPSLSELTKRLLRKTLTDAIPEVLALCDPKEKGNGGWFRMYHYPDFSEGFPSMEIQEFGRFGDTKNMVKARRHEIYSFEKAIRLASNAYYDHVSSWQTRRPEEFRRGGAVLINAKIGDLSPEPTNIIMSFSGLPEKADEALVLALAQRMPWEVAQDQLTQIADISNNDLARSICMLEKKQVSLPL